MKITFALFPLGRTKCAEGIEGISALPADTTDMMLKLTLLKTITMFRLDRKELQQLPHPSPLQWSNRLHHTSVSGSLQSLWFLLRPGFSCHLLSRTTILWSLQKV